MPDISNGPSNSEETVDDAAFRHLRRIALEIDENDFVRHDPPAELWDRLATKITMPVDLESRRPRRALWLAGAAAAVVAVLGVSAVLRDGDTQSRLLAKSTLTNEGLSRRGAGSSGEATLRRVDGQLVLHVEVDDAPDTQASYLELWMIDRKVQGMVSLGPFHGSGDYAVPNGVDPNTFPVVDVSIEPGDGVPTHSGESIVRGVLQ